MIKEEFYRVMKKKSGSEKRKVVIIDDHPVLREGIATMIGSEDDFEVCGQASNSKEAIAVVEKNKPDVAIVDISLEDVDGLELVKNIKSISPEISVLVLSVHPESIYAERAIRTGADGYVMKKENREVILNAVRTVLDKEIYLSEKIKPDIIRRILGKNQKDSFSPIDDLTNRELEIFRLIGAGLRNLEIAEKLKISEKTVRVHIENIKKKMNIKHSQELHHKAFLWYYQENKNS